MAILAAAASASDDLVTAATPPPANPAVSARPLPAAGTDGPIAIAFAEMFKRPVGPYGLEPSARLQALAGQRVQMVGYVVREEARTPGLFILSTLPISLSDVEDGPADDLPPAVVFVHLQGEDADAVVRDQREPIGVVGVLEIGNRVEANDRVSFVRILLDPRSVAAPASAAARTP